jgi:hypothetical protein
MKINNKLQHFVLILTTMIFMLSGCSGSVLSNNNKAAPDIVAGYQFIIDMLITSNNDLTEGIEYLAIDTTNLQGISPDEQLKLIQSLDRYKWKVLNKTYAQLESEGLVKDLYFEKGILITIKDVRISGSRMTVNVFLFRGGLAAQGLDDLVIGFMDGEWSVLKTGVTWVA